VDLLRGRGKAVLSLVATEEERVVGHILFSLVTIEEAGRVSEGIALGPMAVLPERQSAGVGSTLVRAGLERCREAARERVVVLGHPAYYPRFGFVPASRFGLRCEYDVPDEVFMAMELKEGAFEGIRGLVKYAPEFTEV
jgi:putative acetyltransferase